MSLEIDFNINPWLDKTSLTEKPDFLNKLLNLGYQVSNMAQISFSPSSSLLKPINDTVNNLSSSCQNTYKQISDRINHSNKIYDMNVNVISDKIKSLDSNISNSISTQMSDMKKQYNQLSDTIIKLTGDVSTSSIKGKIGENFLENILKTNFPDDSVVIKANIGHESDIHLCCKNSSDILIESKIYKSPVNTAQIEKFYKDMERTGIKLGIFVSITSSIIGHHRLEYINRKDKHIMFIPNAGFEAMKIVYAVLFLKEIEKRVSSINPISTELIDEKCQIIIDSTKILDNVFQCLTRLRGDAVKSKNIIDDQMRKIISNILETEICTKKIISDLKQNISDTLEDLNTNYSQIENDKLEEIIQELVESSNKVNKVVGNTLQIVRPKITRIYNDSKSKTKKYILFRDEEKFCELVLKKCKAQYDFCKSGISFTIKSNTDISNFVNILEIV